MKKILLASRFLAAVLIVFSVARCNEQSQAAPPPKEEAIPVRAASVQTIAWAPVMKYAGTLASTSEARLSFKVGGIISKIYVKEGDPIGKGQLLAALDMTEINARVQQARQSVDKAQRDKDRVQHLYRDTVASLEQLQNGTTQLDLAHENLRIALFDQQYAQIRATENGTVVKKLMNEGELAAAGTPVLYVNGTGRNDWVARFGVSDKDWALLKKGDPATVTLDAYPDRIFKGTVSKLAQGADPASGTYEVEVTIQPRGARFATGLFATVQLQSRAGRTVTLLPVEALAEGDGHNGIVYVVNPDRKTVTRKAVQIAFIQKDKIAVNGGLENGSQVVTDGVGYLTPHSLIKLEK